MFGKQKVKGHNRLTKTKKGFQVIRVQDFFRKEDEKMGRNLVMGAGALALLGGAILLKKKGVELPKLLKKKTKSMVVKVDDLDNLDLTPRPGYNQAFDKKTLENYKVPTPDKKKVTEEVVKKAEDAIVVKDMTSVLDDTPVKPPTETVVKPKDVDAKIDTAPVVKDVPPEVVKKTFDKLADPWSSPIPSKSGVRGTKLLTKKPPTRKRLSKSRLLVKKPKATEVSKKKDLT